MTLNIRNAVPADADACGRIIYNAFKGVAEAHGFLSDIPSEEMGISVAQHHIAHPSYFGVVAEMDGKIVGSNFLDERDAIKGLGPITIDPEQQQSGIGRQLMQAAIERGREAAGIRLMQDAFNVVSMSLYAKLGFEVREPLLLVTGKPKDRPDPGSEVRRLKVEDLEECAGLCRKVHDFDRTNELAEAVEHSSPFVLLRNGRIRAYASAVDFWAFNHGVAETDEDMFALLRGASAATGSPLGFLLPTRQSKFFRWCLEQDLRATSPRTLMSMGKYTEPKGCYFPSVLY